MDHEKELNFGPDTKILFKNTQFVYKMKKFFGPSAQSWFYPLKIVFRPTIASKIIRLKYIKRQAWSNFSNPYRAGDVSLSIPYFGLRDLPPQIPEIGEKYFDSVLAWESYRRMFCAKKFDGINTTQCLRSPSSHHAHFANQLWVKILFPDFWYLWSKVTYFKLRDR